MYDLPFAWYIGAQEVWVIGAIVLVLFGGSRIPQFARGFGEAIREFKKSVNHEEDAATPDATNTKVAATAGAKDEGKQG